MRRKTNFFAIILILTAVCGYSNVIEYHFPEFNKIKTVKNTFQTMEANCPLHLIVTDKDTGKRIPSFEGFICYSNYLTDLFFLNRNRIYYATDGGDVDIDHTEDVPLIISNDGSGEFRIPNLLLAIKNLLDQDKQEFSIGIKAPGYAKTVFHLSRERIFNNKPIHLELESGAEVKGRLVWDKHNKPQEVSVILKNPNTYFDYYQNYAKPQLYCPKLAITPESDGSFQESGILPCEGWRMHISIPDCPDIVRDLKIQKGVNDLGVIPLGKAVFVKGVVWDEYSKPIVGAKVRLLLSSTPDLFVSPDESLKQTGMDGSFIFSLNSKGKKQQAIRIIPTWGIPPWGIWKKNQEGSIFYDKEFTIDLYEENELTLRVRKGKTLKLSLPVTDRLVNILKSNSLKSTRGISELRIGSIRILSKKPDEYGLRYHAHCLLGDDGVVINDKVSLDLEVSYIPPGEYYLSLDSHYYEKDVPNWQLVCPHPIAFCEFIMPDSDYALPLTVSECDLKVNLSGTPENFNKVNLSGAPENFNPEKYAYFVKIARREPISMAFPPSFEVFPKPERSWERGNLELSDYRSPFFTRIGFFKKKEGIPQAVISPIPPGEYIITLNKYKGNVFDSESCWEKQIEILHGMKEFNQEIMFFD